MTLRPDPVGVLQPGCGRHQRDVAGIAVHRTAAANLVYGSKTINVTFAGARYPCLASISSP